MGEAQASNGEEMGKTNRVRIAGMIVVLVICGTVIYRQLGSKLPAFLRAESLDLETKLFFQIDSTLQGKNLQIPIRMVHKVAKCYLGDIDAMNMEAQYAKGSRFIMTLEPLAQKQLPMASQEISLRELSTEFSRTLSLQLESQPAHYGIFICRDTAKTNRCQNKKMVDLNQIFHKYFNDKAGFADYAKVEKIYFFQYLLLQKHRVLFLTNEIEKDIRSQKPTQHQRVGRYLVKAHDLDGKAAENLVKTIWGFNKGLASETMRPIDGAMQITLPRIGADCDLDAIGKLYRAIK